MSDTIQFKGTRTSNAGTEHEVLMTYNEKTDIVIVDYGNRRGGVIFQQKKVQDYNEAKKAGVGLPPEPKVFYLDSNDLYDEEIVSSAFSEEK